MYSIPHHVDNLQFLLSMWRNLFEHISDSSLLLINWNSTPVLYLQSKLFIVYVSTSLLVAISSRFCGLCPSRMLILMLFLYFVSCTVYIYSMHMYTVCIQYAVNTICSFIFESASFIQNIYLAYIQVTVN